MKKQIKFRGKSMCDVGFVYGDLIHKRNGLIMIQDENGLGTDVDECTIGQFTGLRDKNRVDIYEGDIVDSCDDHGIIEFDCGVFGINWDYGTNHKTMYGTWGQRHNLRKIDDEIIDEVVVIGNIYDNKELINK